MRNIWRSSSFTKVYAQQPKRSSERLSGRFSRTWISSTSAWVPETTGWRLVSRHLVEIGLNHGVTLVSALEADGQRCLPGCLRGVIGVGLDWECDRESYRYADGPEFYASGYPRSLPGVTPARNLHGISFAVANMTGIIARACEDLTDRSPRTISQALAAESLRVTAPAVQ